MDKRFSICNNINKNDAIEILKSNLSIKELIIAIQPNYNHMNKILNLLSKKEIQCILYNCKTIEMDKIHNGGINDKNTEVINVKKIVHIEGINIVSNCDDIDICENMKDNNVINVLQSTQASKKIKIISEAVNNENELYDIEIIEPIINEVIINKVSINEVKNNIKKIEIIEKCLISKEDDNEMDKLKHIDIENKYNFKDIKMELLKWNLNKIQIQEYFSIKQKEHISYLIGKYKMNLEDLKQLPLKDIYDIMRINFYEEQL